MGNCCRCAAPIISESETLIVHGYLQHNENILRTWRLHQDSALLPCEKGYISSQLDGFPTGTLCEIYHVLRWRSLPPFLYDLRSILKTKLDVRGV